jgi:hypothetical protein
MVAAVFLGTLGRFGMGVDAKFSNVVVESLVFVPFIVFDD